MATQKKEGKIFEEYAKPNENGISDYIDVSSNNNKILNVNNGSNYSRQTSYLYEKYYLLKTYEKGVLDTKVNNQKNAGIGLGKLLTIKLNGFRNDE